MAIGHGSIRGRRVRARAVAAAVAMALIGAACGGSGGDSTEAGPTTTEDPDLQKKIDENKASGQDTRAAADEKPVPGGTLIYGVEADSANPWVPYATSCAISCYQVLRTVSEPLFVADKDAKVVPYLLSKATPSADYKQWTFTARPGITFHDGTPFDGAAIKYNIDTCRASALTGPAYAPITKTEANGQDAILTLSLPMGSLPASFLAQCGYMFSPKWMKTLDSNPLRKDGPLKDAETAATPGGGKQTEPVGLGAFKFKSYTPGNGNAFIATKNPDYWRKAEGLPYLDEVQLVVAVDIQSRSNGLRGGQFSIIHTANADEIKKFRDEKARFTLLEANAYGETNYILLNVAQGTNPTFAALTGKDGTMDPQGKNAASPITNERCRRALAHALDRDRVAKERGAGIVQAANGPFPPGSLGYLADSGYPKFDLAAAKTELDACLAEIGKPSVEFAFNTTNDPFNVETNQLIASMWRDAFGDKVKVTVTPIEQGQYIGLALAGSFQAQGWRNHGGIDPDQQFNWWHSATASPIGASALNFGRFVDPEIDAALLAQRTNPDPAARKAAMETVNREFGKHVYNWWTTWTLWGVVANPNVRTITDLPLPDNGGTSLPIASGGHYLAQIWCNGGKCN